jgi:hypothetical protein
VRRTATDLRAHLYEVLDYVATTGRPVEISRGGVELCIVRKEKTAKRRIERAQTREQKDARYLQVYGSLAGTHSLRVSVIDWQM